MHIEYRKKSYFNHFAGFSWRLQKLSAYFPILFPRAKVLDVGCGPGDWCAYLSLCGYRTTGVDFSPTALSFCQNKPGNFQKMEATSLRYQDNSWDAVCSIEVAEHLTQSELVLATREAYRVLKPGGWFFLHTEPNRWFMNYFYPLWAYPVGSFLISLNNRLFGSHFPPMVKPHLIRSQVNQKTHINEPTWFSLRQILVAAGFRSRIYSTNLVWNKPILSWKDSLFNLVVWLDPFSRYWPLQLLAGQDFLVVTRKK